MSENLKAFEKSWDSLDCKITNCNNGEIGCDEICKEIRRETWKAAMEQVLIWGSDDDVLFNKIKDEIYLE